jgi:hypothetical protein
MIRSSLKLRKASWRSAEQDRIAHRSWAGPPLACSWVSAAIVGWCALNMVAGTAIAWETRVIASQGRPIVAAFGLLRAPG